MQERQIARHGTLRLLVFRQSYWASRGLVDLLEGIIWSNRLFSTEMHTVREDVSRLDMDLIFPSIYILSYMHLQLMFFLAACNLPKLFLRNTSRESFQSTEYLGYTLCIKQLSLWFSDQRLDFYQTITDQMRP